MPRVTKADLERENAELKAELEQRRERSRSRHRKVHFDASPMDATTRRALDVVRKHDRDSVIEEQRATIARQAQEISALQKGSGPIGRIFLASWTTDISDSLRERFLKNHEPVGAFLRRKYRLMYNIEAELLGTNG